MIKYADLNAQRDADADFNGSEMLICRFQCRHNLLFYQQIHLLQLHQTIKYADLNDRGDADADLNGSEMLICRSQDQQIHCLQLIADADFNHQIC